MPRVGNGRCADYINFNIDKGGICENKNFFPDYAAGHAFSFSDGLCFNTGGE
jgi:hypothetical protein